ncbi:hypothetical protein [Archangium sp.]|uniref:hypothetical protein n=1 Tax=Archangium sp. TaxID=1872627 RepID=UPI00286A1927|nr:hypothetical protein [Archangium sp.]
MKNLSLSPLLAVVLCGCGPEGQRFHGVYDVTGTAHFSIQNFGNYSAPLVDAFRVSEGTTSDLLLTDPAGRCLLLANLEGEVATLQSGSCTWSHHGATLTLTLTRGTVAFSGTSAQLHMSGTATATAQGKLHHGAFFQSATLHYRGP